MLEAHKALPVVRYYSHNAVPVVWVGYKFESSETSSLIECTQYFIFFFAPVTPRNDLYLGVDLLISVSPPWAQKPRGDRNLICHVSHGKPHN